MPRERAAEPDLEVYWDRGEALVIFRGDLDGVSAADLSERLLEIDKVLGVLNGERRRMVVDVAGVRLINQAAVRALVSTRQRLSPECHLLLRSPSRAARRSLAPSGLLEDGYLADGQVAGASGNGQSSQGARRQKAPR